MQSTSRHSMLTCLVCGRSSPVTHMAINVCRACAVFYKRNKPIEKMLTCNQGTQDCKDFRKGNFSCRFCRMRRFNDIFKTCSKGNELIAIPSSSSASPPSPSSLIYDNSAIDIIRRYYQRISVIRREKELMMRGVPLRHELIQSEHYEITPCTYQIMNQSYKILISSLFDFAAAICPPFRTLDSRDQWLLIRNFYTIFHCIETHMRSRRAFPMESGKFFGTYTTYLAPQAAEIYFSDCANRDKAVEASRTLEQCIRANGYRIRDYLARIRPTDEEFMGLLGLALWSVESIDVSDGLSDLASEQRRLILRMLAQGYAQAGEAQLTASRIGELFGIIQLIKKIELDLRWEYEVYRMLEVFDDHTYMYKMQMHKPTTTCKSLGYA